MVTHCWTACYELILKEAEQFVLSCHNFDCENSTADAWLAAWKNSVRMNILEPPSCACCNQQLLHIFKKSCKLVTYTLAVRMVHLNPTPLHLLPLTNLGFGYFGWLPSFFRSIAFWPAYGWIVFPLLKLLSFFRLTYYCSIGLCFSVRV